jgi:hypothetical protein
MSVWRNLMMSAAGKAAGGGGGTLYEAVVLADTPLIYWRCNTAGSTFANLGSLGPAFTFDGLENGTNFDTGLLGPTASPGNNFSLQDGIIQDFTNFSSALYPTAYQACSLECWFHTTDANGVLLQIQDPLVSNNTGRSFEIIMNIDGLTLRANRRNSRREGTTTVNTGAVHHVVATAPTANPDGPVKLYVDGAEEFGATAAGVTGSVSSSFALNAGANVVGGGNVLNPLNLQEVAVYDYELSSAQVLAHYNAGIA